MAWIESHNDLEHHPKLTRLMLYSGLSRDTCIGKLHRLWWWAMRYAEDGNLSKYDPNEIMISIGSEGLDECKKLLEALTTSGFLDTQPYLRVHDWWDYAGRFLQSKYKHYPEKWANIKELCHQNMNRSKTSSKTSSKNSVDASHGSSKHPIPNQPTNQPPIPGLSPDIWVLFEQHRKTKRSPLTNSTVDLIGKKLLLWSKQGMNPDDVLKRSIENGWTGIFPLPATPAKKEASIADQYPEL